jgi:hypothetical protein
MMQGPYGFRIRLALLPLLWLLLPGAGTAQSQGGALEYKVTPCCTPCAAVNNPANYNTGFLSIFPILMRGKDDWLFRSEVELMTAFGPTPEGLHQLKVFSDLLKERGTQLVMIYHPTRGLVHRSMLRQLRLCGRQRELPAGTGALSKRRHCRARSDAAAE